MLRITYLAAAPENGAVSFRVKRGCKPMNRLPAASTLDIARCLADRVTSASCEDGHATATGGANHQARRRARSRHRTVPHRSSRAFLNQKAPSPSRIGSPSSKHSLLMSRRARTRSPWPKRVLLTTAKQLRRDRNRRRGRRGRGGRPQPSQPPTIPGPGGPTGEGAEAEAPVDVAEPAAQPAAQGRSKQPKGAVVLSIGLPGSGKSTWFKRHNILPLSSDMVRILLFDDVTEQRYQDLVFSTLRSMLRARLLARRPSNYSTPLTCRPMSVVAGSSWRTISDMRCTLSSSMFRPKFA